MMGLIMLLAVAVRLYAINAFPLEQDELYTITESTDLFGSPYLPSIRGRPLYYLLEHPLVTVLPHTPMVLRALPFLFGLAGVWVSWKLGLLIAGRKTGAIAALLAALSPWHMYASGMARYWSLVYLLAAAAYLFIVRAVESGKTRDYLLASVTLMLGVLTHPSFTFILPGVLAAVVITAWPKWPQRNAWVGLIIPLAAFFVVFYTVLSMTGGTGALRNWSGRGAAATLRLVPAIADWVTPVVVAASLLGGAWLWRSGQPRQRLFGVMMLLGSLSVIVALLAASFTTDVYADYGMAALPLVLVSAASLVIGLAPKAALSVAVLLVAGMLPSSVSYLSDGSRFDYRWAYERIANNNDNLPVLAWPKVIQERYGSTLEAYPLFDTPKNLDSLLARRGAAWAVVSVARYGTVGDDSGKLAPWLVQRCKIIDARQGKRFDYRMYRVELHYCSKDGGNSKGEYAAHPT